VPRRPSQTLPFASRARSRPILLVLPALLAGAIAMLLCGPAATLAKTPRRACASAAKRSAADERACVAHHGSTHKRHKGERHRKKHRAAKKNDNAKRGSTTVAVPAQEPASCDDGTSPARAADGAYACGDGSEPECANGSEPILAPRRSELLCPAASSGVEWSEASCDDGSAPTPASAGGYACEDGSTPECEDGSTPLAPDEGSQPTCIESDSTGSAASPVPAASEAEAEGAEDVDASSARVASAS
jgi:hypothetical protein